MNTPLPNLSEPTDYLAEAAKLRRLARRLLDDAHVVEDVVNATLAASIHRQYRDAAHRSRSLWAGVRNAINDHRRSTANRAARERVAARPEELPAADESLTRIETSQLVLDELRQLDELYRAALTRHYLQELSLKAIAAQDGVDLDTVHQRLSRGRKQLRERLERRAGGPENLLGLLIPFAAPRLPETLRSLKSAASSPVVGWAAGILLFLGLGALFWFTPEIIDLSLAAAPSPTSPLASTLDASALDSRNAARTAVESEQRVELRVVTGSGAQRVADAAITWWPLPQRPNAAKEVEYWLQNNILEDRTRDGAVEHVADANGVAQLPWSSTGFLAIASKGSLWGYTVVRANHRGPARVEVCEDLNLEVFVPHQPTGEPLEGMIVQLAAVRQLGDVGYSDVAKSYIAASTDRDGIARLRHVGAVKHSATDLVASTAVLLVGPSGDRTGAHFYLEAEDLARGRIEAPWTGPVAHVDIEVENAPTGLELYRYCAECNVRDLENTGLVVMDGHARIAVEPDVDGDRDWLNWKSTELELLWPDGVRLPHASGEIVSAHYAVRERATSPTVAVSGRLIDAKGRPLRMLTVSLLNGDGDHLGSATTDGNGRFSVSVDPSLAFTRECELYVVAPSRSIELRSIDLPDSGQVTLGDIEVNAIAASIRGRVVDLRGDPVVGARLRVLYGSVAGIAALGYPRMAPYIEVESDGSGSFEVPIEPLELENDSGLVTVVVNHSGYRQRVLQVQAGEPNVAIELAPCRPIEGRVLLDQTISAGSVWIEYGAFSWELNAGTDEAQLYAGKAPSAVQRRRLALDGSFELNSLGDGDSELRVLHYGCNAVERREGVVLHAMTVDPERATDIAALAQIDLRGMFTMHRFEVIDRARRPVSGVSLRVEGSDLDGAVTVDSAGRASLLVPRGARVRVESEDFYDDLIDLVGDPVRVRLERPEVLRVRLTGELPDLDEGYSVKLVNASQDAQRKFSTVLSSAGDVQIEAADRNRVEFTFVVRSNGHSEPCTAPQVIDLVPGQAEPYLIQAPTQAEIDAAVRVLRSR